MYSNILPKISLSFNRGRGINGIKNGCKEAKTRLKMKCLFLPVSELLMTGSHELPVSQAKIVSIIGKNQNNRYRIRPPQDSELSVPERLCRTSLLHPVWTVLPSHPSMDGDIRNACSDTHAPSEDALSAYRIQDISEWRESSDRPHGRLSSS